jgi:hypothetical protein
VDGESERSRLAETERIPGKEGSDVNGYARDRMIAEIILVKRYVLGLKHVTLACTLITSLFICRNVTRILSKP